MIADLAICATTFKMDFSVVKRYSLFNLQGGNPPTLLHEIKVYLKSRGTDCKIGDHFYTLR